MIGILLKHVILDQCLSIAFDRLGKNMSTTKVEYLNYLKATFTIESAKDLQSFHSMDVQREILDALSYEIQSEIDSEILSRAMALAERYAGTMG